MNLDEQCVSLGPRLRQIRKTNGMTQTELCEHLARSGVPGRTQVVIHKIESGTRPVKLAEAVVYARLAGITVERLIDPAPIEHTATY